MAKADVFRGKTALVTGASSGIGLEFCRQLAQIGARLVMVSNQEQQLADCAREIADAYGVKVDSLCLDLTAPDCAERLLAFTDSLGAEVDLLINNAGIFSFAPLLDTPERKVNAFIDLHMRAVTALCMAYGRRMSQRGEGYILNMSSMSCWMPMPGLAMYSATKAYIRTMSRALHCELRDSGVSVTVACPGGISTTLFGLPDNLMRLALRLHAVDTPERFVRKALKKTAQRRQQYINGLLNRLAIVFISTLPRRVRLIIKHRLLDRGISRP